MLGFLVENPCRNKQDFLLMVSSKLRFALFCKSKLLSLLLLWTEEARWSFECMYGLLLTSLTRDHFALFHEDWPQLPQFSDSTYGLSDDDHNMYYYVPPRVTDKLHMELLILLPQWSLQAEGFQVQICVLSFCAHSGWFTCTWCQVSHCRWCCATNAYITVGNQIQLLVSMVFPSQCSRVQKMAPCSTVLECESYWTQLLVPRVVQTTLVHIISDQKI